VRRSGIEEIGGRGLEIVAALADRWGIHEGSSHVWFEMRLPVDDPAESAPLLGTAQVPDELR
jgi:hypothetical protein